MFLLTINSRAGLDAFLQIQIKRQYQKGVEVGGWAGFQYRNKALYIEQSIKPL